MKFPYELSYERLSLLTEEDKKIYEMEHSGLYNLETKIVPNVGFINEDAEVRKILDKQLFETEFDSLLDKEIIEAVGIQEYIRIKNNLFDFIENDPELQGELFEAPGHAADWWLPEGLKLKWLGKLAAGLLTGLLGIAAWLFMKGKDRLAMKKLKQYMNKLVELIDMGINKKRPWYSFLMASKKNRNNTGDFNKACFRTIQETAERNMACLYTQCIHNLGFLSPDLTDFRGITSGLVPMEGSGLYNFKNAMVSNMTKLQKIDDLMNIGNELASSRETNNVISKFLPIAPSLNKFNSLKLPALPTNYTMLMCNIEYPAKSDKNPNGSLFMKPTQEILQAKAEDIGQVYFNQNMDINHIINYDGPLESPSSTSTGGVSDSYINPFNNPYIQMLLEAENDNNEEENEEQEEKQEKTNQETGAGRDIDHIDVTPNVLTPDIDPTAVLGTEIETHTEGKQKTKVKHFEGNIIEAIDGYMRSSIPVIQKLVKAICGNQQSRDTGALETIIAQLINAGEGRMSDYMKKNDTVLKQLLDDNYRKTESQFKDHTNAVICLASIIEWAESNKEGLKDYFNRRGVYDKMEKVKDEIFDDWDKGTTDLDILLKRYLGVTYKQIKDFIDNPTKRPLPESYNFLQEDAQFRDKETGKQGNEILDELEKTLDTTYNEVRNFLTERISTAINSDPKDWYIITSSRERMNKLKEAADKEITAKIELICRLAGEGKTDIGDKFKSAISKHPIRAESLKRIWAMYSDDLQDRIETRLRSIVGDNGNSNILTTIKQFLINVYPNLMATMLYYKQILFLINLYTRRNNVPVKFFKQLKREEEDINKTVQLTNLRLNCRRDPAEPLVDSSTATS